MDLQSTVTPRRVAFVGRLGVGVEAADGLVEIHLGMARAVSSRYGDHGVDHTRLDDAARVGLAAAASSFDPDAGTDFVTHALPYVRAEVKRVFRAAGGHLDQPIPRSPARVVRHPSDSGSADPFG